VGQPRIWYLFWPPVTDDYWRRSAILAGYIAFFPATIWGLIAIVGAVLILIATDLGAALREIEALAHTTVSLAIGWGIYKRSRIAAIAGLVWSLAGLAFGLVTLAHRYIVPNLAFAFAFTHSCRGIFKHRRIMRDET
jgi:hypothetical protein